MTPDVINAFLAVKNTRTITEAAEMLHLSQSAVSHRLKLLEEELAVRLVVRRKGQKNVELTAHGKEFIPIAERWLSLDEEARLLKNRVHRTRIAIAGVDSVNHYVLPALYATLCAQHPLFELEIRTPHSWEIYELLASRSIDVGIVNNDALRPNIVSSLLFQEDYVVIGDIASIMPEQGRFIHPQILDPGKEVFQNYSPDYQQWHHFWFGEGRSVVQVNVASMIAPFLRGKGAWSIVPLSVAIGLTTSDRCAWRYLLEAPPRRSCYLITHKHPKEYNGEAVKRFVVAIRACVQARETPSSF
jgi:DNA-binding transcriptional LysR family regulator